MHRGFNLTLDTTTETFKNYQEIGKQFMAATWPKVKPTYDLLDADVINADDVMADWFKQVDANVFISHSHDDKDVALGLAGFLKHHLGLRPFIDSLIWEDSNTLLRAIDEKYCKADDKIHFDYDKRNYSTSHVRMMLASSLTEAIDRSECILFLNTPASIKVSDAEKKAAQKTASPWIYHELNTSRLIRPRPIARPAVSLKAHRTATMESASFEYSAPVAHLTPLDNDDLLEWAKIVLETKLNPLGALYALHPASVPKIPAHD